MELGRHKPSDRQAAGVFLLREGAEFLSDNFTHLRRAALIAVEGKRCRVYGSKAARWWAVEGVEMRSKRQNETADAVKSCVRLYIKKSGGKNNEILHSRDTEHQVR